MRGIDRQANRATILPSSMQLEGLIDRQIGQRSCHLRCNYVDTHAVIHVTRQKGL